MMPCARLFVSIIFVALLLAGCSDRPKAPPLSNEAVYLNDKIGLRFLAPEGWPIVSRADLPPGRLPKAIILVGYMLSKGDKPAEFELLAVDLAENTDLGQFLMDHRSGPEKWALKSPSSSVTINGVTAQRYSMARGTGKDEFRREATAFRRGERVYFFVITFGIADSDRRDQAHRSIESVTWTR